VVNSVLKLLTFFLLLLGLVGLYAYQSEAAGPLGLVGCLAAFLGTMLLSGDLWLEAFAFPYLRKWPPGDRATPHRYAGGGWLSVVHYLRPQVATVRGRQLASAGVPAWRRHPSHRRRGVIGFGLFIFPGAGILLAVAVGWMGFSLRQSDRGSGDGQPQHVR